MNKQELTKILELHEKWLRGEPDGVRANLAWANLAHAHLAHASLSNANLAYANLAHANLTDANLYHANLADANLAHANLHHANLYHANLYHANLTHANLYHANLAWANLAHASLSNANLAHAHLYHANLAHANLPDYKICPEEGDFVGWKKSGEGYIIKLLVIGQRNSSLVGRKCRADKVRVLDIIDPQNPSRPVGLTHSCFNSGFEYKLGEVVEEPNYNDDHRVECTEGIHFFITRKEAEEY